MKRYEFLEHVSDAYVAAYGKTLEEAFQNAAEAMFETMIETSTVALTLEEVVKVEGHDREELLYNWLEALLLKFEIEGKVYRKFEIEDIKERNSGFALKAIIRGEPYDAEKHRPKVEVKAVTYHQMEIKEQKRGYEVKFILDL